MTLVYKSRIFLTMRLVSLVILFFAAFFVSAQETTNFSQFFVDPYSFNPSFAGAEGRAALFITYRRQWADFEGAPAVGNLAFHTALSKNVNFGVNFNNDQRSVLNTSSALMTLGYTARFAQGVFMRFGFSAGAASNALNLTAEEMGADPALAAALDNNMFLLGNAGLSLHIKSLHLGVSIPNLYDPKYVDSTEFNFGFTDIRPTEQFIFSASNRFYFGQDRHVFEPYFLYRMHKNLPSQMEAAAIVHLNHTLWFGGTYKQDFGIGGTVGIKTSKFGVGYAYTFKNIGLNKISSPTHEVTLSLLFGERKPPKQKYSFISTIFEKDPIPVKEITICHEGEKMTIKETEWSEHEGHGDVQGKCPPPEPTFEICHQGSVITVKESEWATHRAHGDVRGECPEPTLEICHEGSVITIKESEWPEHQSHGDNMGECAPEPTIIICHEGNSMEIPAAQWSEHEAHGDLKGNCPPPELTYTICHEGTEITIKDSEWPAHEAHGDAIGNCPVEQTFTVCHEGSVISIKESEWSAHQAHGDTMGACPEPTMTICHDNRTITIKESEWSAHQAHGDEQGECVPIADVVVKKGSHPMEIPVGSYVVVGVYSSEANASKYSNELKRKGYQEARFGYITQRGYWYVYVHSTDDPKLSRQVRDSVRKVDIFGDAWTLEVQD